MLEKLNSMQELIVANRTTFPHNRNEEGRNNFTSSSSSCIRIFATTSIDIRAPINHVEQSENQWE